MDPAKETYGSSAEILDKIEESCAFACRQISLQCLSLISTFLGSCKERVLPCLKTTGLGKKEGQRCATFDSHTARAME